MEYTYDQLAGKGDQELFNFQLQYPPNHHNFLLAEQILEERSRKELRSVETKSLIIALVALGIAFISFALSVL